MDDTRISIRLTPEEHTQLKTLVAKRRTKINQFVHDFIRNEIDAEKTVVLNKAKAGARVLSLFANIGVAEAYFEEIGINIVLANELVKRRADLYSQLYPDAEMKCGDITDKKLQDYLIARGKELGVNIIMATPPCQGMSTAGKQEEDDIRNNLIVPVVRMVKELAPKYVFIENVPMFLQTEICVNGKKIIIPEYLKQELGTNYEFKINKIDTKHYGVPQTRERAIILLTRRDMTHQWLVPVKESKIVTMFDAIGHLPPLDPFVRDVSREELLRMFPKYEERAREASKISRWHFPPEHIRRQVEVMMHTPTGCTAFDNEKEFQPQKDNGELVKGFRNTYKRQDWDTPAYTVTMDNRKISSQNNVHPGRPIGTDEKGNVLYSDARTLTVYELMLISSIPGSWPLPADTPPAFLRSIIGEGIPPLFVKKVFEQLRGVDWSN